MDTSNTISPVTTVAEYLVLGAIGIFVYIRYFAPRKPPTAKQPARQQRSTDPASASDSKKKAEKAAKPKPKPKPATATAPKEAASPSVNPNNWDVDDAADKKADREFARQLSTAHSGTKFNAKKSDEKKHKSVKQSKAEEVLSVPAEKPSAPSSHAGDADDDLSPPTSPPTGGVNGHDVSDMLEPSAPGPSVLRLTDTESVKPKERKAKPVEVVETKKQRQNRKKAEAAKAAREEAEQVRKVQLEQQRRTARIAEGRAAKDGSAFVGSQKNAWNQKPTNGDTVQPLDTFEKPQPQPKSEPKKAVAAPAVKKQETADPWLSGVPSEEEQMELLRQEESWSEVKTKKKGKKNTSTEASTTPVPPTNGTNGTNGASATPSNKSSAPSGGVAKRPIITSSSSSFAALTPEETDDNDDVEQEWDV
ncbi:hypothetical protein SLS62_000696 [Diatrype stigma]|uniref:Uncharacterized protein n=1 Tax=Diatrype stigma TaxID=117547 RepID=A0AAN9VBM7_9PEZI